MIKFQNTFIRRGSINVLKNINLEIDLPANIAITGPMGSGKSTFLDALAGRIFPFKGKIVRPEYKEIVWVPRDYSFHRIVGAAYQYYQQRYQAFDSEIGPTVLEVLQNQVKPIGSIDEKSVEVPDPTYSLAEIHLVAKKMNIDHLLDRKITTLSNGETRRTLISIALLKKPILLLLDNPFTGLDTDSKKQLKQTLNGLPSNGTSLVMIADFADLPECMDTLIYLKSGEILRIEKKPFQKNEQPDSISAYTKTNLKNYFPATDTEFETVVKFENTSVFYGQKAALSDINWEVKKGESWALLGPNGSGKSTLLSMIMADNPQAYQNKMWLFDRRRGSGESIWDIKKRIGFVSPELHLFFSKQIPVWKVVASGLFDSAGLFQKLSSDQNCRVFEMLELFEIANLKDRMIAELSLGEQRTAFLARALVKNSPLLLLDEACQNLDYNHMVYFREMINEIVSRTGKTLIYVTHNQEEIPTCVNNVFRLNEGRRV